MENASKALIMAAEMLIGVMILSIGIVIFSNFADYSEQRYKEIEASQIAKFNDKFLKYAGSNATSCTIHDIVSLANLAQRHNLDMDAIQKNADGDYSVKPGVVAVNENFLYIRIDLDGQALELKSSEKLVELIKGSSINGNKVINYKCVDYKISKNTKKVYYMKFKKIP